MQSLRHQASRIHQAKSSEKYPTNQPQSSFAKDYGMGERRTSSTQDLNTLANHKMLKHPTQREPQGTQTSLLTAQN